MSTEFLGNLMNISETFLAFFPRLEMQPTQIGVGIGKMIAIGTICAFGAAVSLRVL